MKWHREIYQNNEIELSAKGEHIHSEQSEFQKIDFYKNETLGTFFTLDDCFMVSENDEFSYHDMIVHPAFAVNPKIKTILIIGGGDGGTAREVLRYNTIDSVDMVEIDERVVRLCQKYLPLTASKLEDPRIKLYFEDGLEYIKNTKKKYDLILVDSTDPISIGEGLFTQEFYTNCYEKLTDDGILINQHETGIYKAESIAMKKAHDKIKKLFNHSRIYYFNAPLYPSGMWYFGFASKKYDPLIIDETTWNKFKLNTRYYNLKLHKGSFAIPTYVKELLNEK